MFDLKTIKKAIDQVAEEKGIDPDRVLEAIESSIAAAYKKEYEKKGEVIRAKFDVDTGKLKYWQVKTVVDETTVRFVNEEAEAEAARQAEEAGEKKEEPVSEEDLLPRYNADRHMLVDEARAIKPEAQVGDELTFPLEPQEEFGRIAAQTAKQVILQRLREAERDSILREYQHKEGEIVSGVIQRFERGNIYIDLGRANGIMFYNESIPGEHYTINERLRFLVLAVQSDTRTPGIVLSRAHPKFVSKLFSVEVPEINENIVEIKAIAREPGNRTKIAVASTVEGVDPVGACVGQRGTRVMAVINELGQEKIDIIEWSEDPAKFVGNALSPAKIQDVEVLERREVRVFVPEDQLSLAIGRGGQNVRLAAKLTGWKIDVRSAARPDESQAEATAEGAVNNASQSEEKTDTEETS